MYGQSLNPPDTYDELLEEYKDMFEIAQEYKGLYEEAESDLTKTLKLLEQSEADLNEYKQLYNDSQEDLTELETSVDNLYKLTETQSDMIDDLLNKKQLGIITGLNITPTHIEDSGIILGFTFNF